MQMNRVLSRRGSLRRSCALVLGCLGTLSFGLPSASAVSLDDGVVHTPVSYPATLAKMPVVSPTPSFTVGGGNPSNLGTFDIVINPSAALSANAPALAAFNRAAQNWEAVIADPI